MNYTIIEVNHESADKIPCLMQLVYGNTFSQIELYDAKAICDLIAQEQAIFYMALDQQQVPKALLGLRFYSKDRMTAEFIPFISDPAIRGIETGYLIKGLIDKFIPKVKELNRNGPLKTVYALATTDHPLVIDFCKVLGLVLSGIYLSWTAVASCMPDLMQLNLNADLLDNRETILNGRRADLLYVRVLSEEIKPYQVSIPKQYANLLEKIYSRLNLPVVFTSTLNKTFNNTLYQVKRDGIGKRTIIDVGQLAKDSSEILIKLLAEELNKKIDIIQIFLPLTQCDINDIVDCLSKIGCRFCGLMPFHKGNDALIMQYVNSSIRDIPSAFLNRSSANEMYDHIIGNYNFS